MLQTGVERQEGLVHVITDSVGLQGNLIVPKSATGIVVFAHGSGSSRFSSRNRYVAEELRGGRFATLLLDLLTPSEEAIDARNAQLRFNIEMLAQRLVGTVDWLAEQPEVGHLPIGFFGASTGGGAALVAAAEVPDRIAAVVSRGGRPDLAGDALPHVKAPTLLIVGGADIPVIEMNREALARMSCPRELTIVPGASHLFEEAGKLEKVAELALGWFAKHLR
ncbi:MAG TPA: dienelactone hydrolase family protein [Thermoanaerobaculia bacterium]|nr:dienelactone hydrolase family protein [Thermoanaerobaculia bacterium]